MSQVLVNDTLQEWRETASYWTKHHNTICTMFAPLTPALIKQAHIVQGQSVLDVAGGAGEPSLTIARAVGPLGFVMCTDPIAFQVSDGTAKWKVNLKGCIRSVGDSGDTLFAGVQEGTVYAFTY